MSGRDFHHDVHDVNVNVIIIIIIILLLFNDNDFLTLNEMRVTKIFTNEEIR